MGRLGGTEFLIIFLIVLVLFGGGRIGKIAGEIGSGIRSFKEGLRGSDPDPSDEPVDDKHTPEQ